MKRFTVTFALLMLVASSALQGQETVLGAIDGAGGDCHGPDSPCNGGSGVIKVFGWALATSGVKRVIIQIDGNDYAEAKYNAPRPDVARVHPGFPDSDFAGWALNFNSTLFENRLHTISAKIETFASVGGAGGQAIPTKAYYTLADTKEILFTNNTHVNVPMGTIDLPHRHSTMYGTCHRAVAGDGVCERRMGENCRNSPSDCNGLQIGPYADLFCCGNGGGTRSVDCSDDRCSAPGYTCSDERMIRWSVVRGWAIDTGVEINDAGVGYVELLVNGSLQANSRTGCLFDPLQGGLTNCYGLPRLDVERSYRDVPNSPNAGFRFAMDVGWMIDFGYPRGSNDLKAIAGDLSNQRADIDEFPVNFLCAEEVSEPSFGRIETPQAGRVYSGSFAIQGWALDGEGVDRVDVYIDGISLSGTTYGAGNGSRALVAAEYPGYQDTLAPVWRNPVFDTTAIAEGHHQIQVEVVDIEGDSTIIGELTFRVDNIDD